MLNTEKKGGYTEVPSLNPIVPRDYQKEIIESVINEKQEKRLMVVLPTGTGKTYIFCEIIKQLQKPALILAHRDELISQAVEKLTNIYPTADIGIVKAERNETDHEITVASVQTLTRQSRIESLRSDFGIIVTDEAHHAAAESYKRIYHRYGLYKDSPDGNPLPIINTGTIHLGVTATHERNDKMGLAPLFDKIVYEGQFKDFVDAGWLCDLEFEGIVCPLDLEGIRSTKLTEYGTDFQTKALSQRVNQVSIHKSILNAYLEYAKNRKHTLAFCVDRAHAQALHDYFNENGIPSGYIDGNTSVDERRATLDRFRRQEIKVLFNIMVLTEGFDFPEIDCILLARPSKSPSLLTQIIGRGTRPAPGKENCLVLDVAHSHRVEKNQYGDIIHAGSLLELASLFYPPKGKLDDDKPISENQGAPPIQEKIPLGIRSGPSEYFLGKASSEKSIAAYLKRNYNSQYAWHEDDATEAQMKYIKRLFPKLRRNITKGEAATLLDKRFKKKSKEEAKQEKTCPTCGTPKKPYYNECYICAKRRDKEERKNRRAEENTCPECGAWKQVRYPTCYKCSKLKKQETT